MVGSVQLAVPNRTGVPLSRTRAGALASTCSARALAVSVPGSCSLAGARAWFAAKGLTRPREGRVIAGVAAGFARRYDVNPLVARIIAIGTALVLTPLVYIAAWILMPTDDAIA